MIQWFKINKDEYVNLNLCYEISISESFDGKYRVRFNFSPSSIFNTNFKFSEKMTLKQARQLIKSIKENKNV